MKALLLGGRKSKGINRLRQAFLEKGFEKVDFMLISKLNLVSRGGKTQIVNDGIKISDYDVVYLRAKLKLTPFIEPLLDELKEEGIYTQSRPGSYYINSNEALQLAALNSKSLPITKSVVVAEPKMVKDSTEKFNYPIIFKSYKGNRKIQSILVESPRSLLYLTKSIKMDLDAVVVREFEESDLIQCAVIGEKVFAVRRRWNGIEIEKLGKGIGYCLSDSEKYTATMAAWACGCEVATVKLSNGFVTDVIPDINFSIFWKKTGANIYAEVAELFSKRAKGVKLTRKKPSPSMFDRLRSSLEGVLHA